MFVKNVELRIAVTGELIIAASVMYAYMVTIIIALGHQNALGKAIFIDSIYL